MLSSPPTSGKTTEDMFAYIDEFIEWVKGVNEKTKTTGTAFIDGDEWERALDKAVWDYEVRAKEAYYLSMCLAAIAGECQLTYDWGRHSAEAHLTTDTYTTEYTFHIDQ